MCATREARLVECVGLRFAVGFFGFACVADFDCAVPDAVPDPEVLVAGVAVDCAAPDCPTNSNPNRRTKLP